MPTVSEYLLVSGSVVAALKVVLTRCSIQLQMPFRVMLGESSSMRLPFIQEITAEELSSLTSSRCRTRDWRVKWANMALLVAALPLKMAPRDIAKLTLNVLRGGTEDTFLDPMIPQMYASRKKDAKTMEVKTGVPPGCCFWPGSP